ncbi:tRNA pseudouridine synthase A [bacterium HR10]|uniref:tRNA pseudouridine synthase A n=1 Tax=uncultured Acidobacteriota bacterium TaxID=171953 RepID=H5SFD1_9BACT|nr:tRNA pseudouridine synthase A [uncultured Acidobacteriota bacterium]GBC82277.1 tRNA pseudouridine synthase A [bacterium HR10]
MPNAKLLLQYDGTDFYGWQIQAEARTVQGVLTDVLSRLEHRPVTVHGAGRTDRGVHAHGQVASVFLTREMSEAEWQRALNANLPPDVRVMAVEFVPPDFHARYSAVSKTYRYTLCLGPVLSPFLYRYVHHFPFPLDLAAMREALEVIIGEHDFASFGTRERAGKTTVRRVHEARLWCEGDLLHLEITANGFLRYMVRTLMGTLCEIGRGRWRASDMERILRARDRRRAGPTFPAKGLTLLRVRY